MELAKPVEEDGLRHQSRLTDARRRKLPAFREPQKATLVEHVPAGSGWIHEMKYDGYRCLLAIGGGRRPRSTPARASTGRTSSPRSPRRRAGHRVGSALLDGEIVKVDDKGNTSFSALQQAISEGGRGLTLFLFDALEIDGEDLTRLPNGRAQARLGALLGPATAGRPIILYADHIVGQGEKLFERMCEAGQEGIISKRADCPLSRRPAPRAGSRSSAATRQEFVIIGWTPSDKKGRGFRSLLLAVNEGRKAALRRQGRHRLFADGMDALAETLGGLRRSRRQPARACRAPKRAARTG